MTLHVTTTHSIFDDDILNDLEALDDDLKQTKSVSGKTWDIIICKKCFSPFSIVTSEWVDGNVQCPHCKKLN